MPYGITSRGIIMKCPKCKSDRVHYVVRKGDRGFTEKVDGKWHLLPREDFRVKCNLWGNISTLKQKEVKK